MNIVRNPVLEAQVYSGELNNVQRQLLEDRRPLNQIFSLGNGLFEDDCSSDGTIDFEDISDDCAEDYKLDPSNNNESLEVQKTPNCLFSETECKEQASMISGLGLQNLEGIIKPTQKYSLNVETIFSKSAEIIAQVAKEHIFIKPSKHMTSNKISVVTKGGKHNQVQQHQDCCGQSVKTMDETPTLKFAETNNFSAFVEHKMQEIEQA